MLQGKVRFKPIALLSLGVGLLTCSLGFSSPTLDFNGFGSGYLLNSFTDNLLQPIPRAGLDGMTYSLVGLNLRSDFTEHFAFAGQIVGTGSSLSGTTKWSLNADWAFLTWRPDENFELRVGRHLFPLTLFAEYQDVGVLLPFVKTPITYYRTSPFKSFDGASAEYRIPLGGFSVSVKAMGGSAETALSGDTVNFQNVANLTLGFEGYGLKGRFAASRANIIRTFEVSSTSGSSLSTKTATSDGTTFLNAGLMYDKDVVAILEWRGRFSDNPGPIPSGISGAGLDYNRRTTGMLATLGYRFGKLLPSYSYSSSDFRGLGTLTGMITQHTICFAYQFNPRLVAKAEYDIAESSSGKAILGRDSSTAGNPNGQFGLVGVDFLF